MLRESQLVVGSGRIFDPSLATMIPARISDEDQIGQVDGRIFDLYNR